MAGHALESVLLVICEYPDAFAVSQEWLTWLVLCDDSCESAVWPRDVADSFAEARMRRY